MTAADEAKKRGSWATAFTSRALAELAERWPNPKKRLNESFGAEPGTREYARAYALWRYQRKVRAGLAAALDLPKLWGKDVLEIGCGHGGITCYLASIGPKRVVGIDLNVEHLEYARELYASLQEERGAPLAPTEFLEMNAHALEFEEATFDVVVADNLFEHVTEPAKVLAGARRVLRPGGHMIVPVFSSIHSKWGPHLKHGIRMPWVNLLFSERTIVRALERRAQRHPELYEIYPGISEQAERLRDVRRYKDLNDITYREFKRLAKESGFEIAQFHVHATTLGKVVQKSLPKGSDDLLEVLSTGASALLVAV